MIDLHAHLLPGLDDGARTFEESRALANRAAAEGITAIAATPHVRADYPTTADVMERAVEDLRTHFRESGIDVEVLHGAEVDLDYAANLEVEELRRLTLAQSGRYLLVECPYGGWPLGIGHSLAELRRAGLTPILAHPERNREIQARTSLLAELVEGGALVQVTSASLDGRLGRSSKATAERLLREGLVHLLASDAHTPDTRDAGLLAAVKAVRDEKLADYLTVSVPAAIVAGEPLPPRPPGRRRRLF
ncbi:MAG: CpsB/CapC family capsule biosynthesis tyrosine phosphatase [Gaiellaceae bacterium]